MREQARTPPVPGSMDRVRMPVGKFHAPPSPCRFSMIFQPSIFDHGIPMYLSVIRLDGWNVTRRLIRNGRIVTATEDFVGDVLIDGEVVRALGSELEVGDDVEVHDASGLYVIPGGVDVHTHLDWDFGVARTVDTFATGTKAAAFGGTTTVVDFCNQGPSSPLEALEDWHRRAEVASIDVGAHMILNRVGAETIADVATLIQREGVTSFKLFMAYPGVLMVDDASMFRVMRAAGEHGAVICLHAENGPVIQVLVEEAVVRGDRAPRFHESTRPAVLEGEATQRAIAIAGLTDATIYFVHMSAREALAAVAGARSEGRRVFAETCPHYLFLTLQEYEKDGFEAAKYVMTPPLRSREHQDALWSGLANGSVSAVSTDHCPFCFAEQPYGMLYSKQQGQGDFSKIPNGAPGIETRIALMFDGGVRTGRIGLNRWVELVATSPAKLFGLYPTKGSITPGSDADLVLFDPNEVWAIRAAEHHSRVDYSLFEGREVTGRVKKVFLRGDLIVEGQKWLGRDGQGRFLERRPSVSGSSP
jgi:dihydropyrimidinase